MKIKPEALQGAGESQIVSPNGTVLAKAKRTGEDVVFADIDLEEAKPTKILQHRRPEIYKLIADKPSERNYQKGAESLKVAVCQQVSDIQKPDAKLIVLPELVSFESSYQAENVRSKEHAEAWTLNLISEISKCLTDNYAVTSIRENNAHIGVLISKNGIIFRQKQLHKSNQHSWITDFGDSLETFDLPFGRLAIIVGEDSLYPETFRLAAYQNAEIIAVPFNVQNRWETEFGLLERSVENRFSIIAATRPNKNLSEYGKSMIATISKDFTLWTEWKTRPFDGNINFPIVKHGDNFDAEIYPANSENRFVSMGTDVVDGRAWWLLGDLTK